MTVKLRDEVELAVAAWDAYERTRSGPPVIDYDCRPDVPAVEPRDRLGTFRVLTSLAARAAETGDPALAARVRAHVAYLRAVLGERTDLDTYVRATQGCGAGGWPADYVVAVGEVARKWLDRVGVSWGAGTDGELVAVEGEVDLDAVPDEIRSLAARYDRPVRDAAATVAPFTLTIETADVDDYWAYWLDGAGPRARLRLNLHHARFTPSRLRALVLHEVMGHALQGASYAHEAGLADVAWVRLLSVHAPQQVLLEGLAQALPLFVSPDDELVLARMRLAHYLQLVRAELHVALDAGSSVAACASHARARVPFWSDEEIADMLTDRGANVLLRSYLWSYPAGLDWFVRLADDAGNTTVDDVLRAAYRRPLTPDDLRDLWPAGPAIGGPGGSVELT